MAVWLTLNEGARTGTPEEGEVFGLEQLTGACSGTGGGTEPSRMGHGTLGQLSGGKGQRGQHI